MSYIEHPKKPDLITSFHVLEHLPYQLQSLIEFRNALVDEGKIIIEVPHAQDFLIQSVDLPEFRKFTFWSEHLVLHTKESLEALLKKAGFNKIEVFGYQRYGFTNH
ncbi:methyltransferase domain-containing protein [bacterium]|nr:methyltransferase domain-containing protein [bacterium]